MKMTHKPRQSELRWWSCLALGALLLGIIPVQAQRIFFEDFESLVLGPNVDEALIGAEVWTKGPPDGWVADDSGVPGVGTDLDGVTEWAGWSFADKFWWSRVDSDIQRRDEFTLGTGTVMVADPDEWDDAPHAGSGIPTAERTAQGLWYETYITTSGIDLTGQAANSLVLVFSSSWRPEFDDNFQQTGIVDATYDNGTPGRVLHWVSNDDAPAWVPTSSAPSFKNDQSTNEEIVVPLNNPAGAADLKLTFGMFDAGNDWWWAVDNIAVGVPPLASSVSVNAYAFTVTIIEALGKTVNQGSISMDLDGTPLTTGVTVTPGTGKVLVTYNQEPAVFTPGKVYTVTIRFTANDGRPIVETLEFIGKSFTTVTSTPTSVTAVVRDDLTVGAEVQIDETAGVQVELDGTPVTPDSVTFVLGTPSTLTVQYSQAPTVFASGSSHTFKVTFTTTEGEVVPDEVTFTAPVWTAIPPALGTAVGTGAEPGMRWRTHQLDTARGNTIPLAESQLAGDLGPSVHDPAGHSTPQGADGFFRIESVNFDQAAVTAVGSILGDDFIPGIPGLGTNTAGNTDNIAAEALTFLELQPGLYTMVVQSDDGFQVSTGNADNTTYLVLGTAPIGRTVFYFNIETAGVYFFRLLWYEGGGGANVEWYTVNADGTSTLVNGTDTGAIKAYRTRTVPEPELPVQTAVTDGLVAYWNFDGNFFDSIKDFHGTGRGTNQIEFVDGKAGFGKAIKLNGNDQFVEITGGDENELEFPGGSMSIAGWFKVDAFDTEWQALLSKGEGTNYRVARRAATGTIAYAGGANEGADDVPAVNDGAWHHFVAVSDATGAEFGTALYVDGVRRGVQAALPVLAQSDFNLMIGENPGARNREWEGEIDDIAIWNRVLSAAEVAELYNAGTGTALSTVVDANITGIGLNFGASQAGGTVTATDIAGVPGVAQANWNNLNGQSGTNVVLVGNAGGTAEAVTTTVDWNSNNLWSSTGAGEENNAFTGPDRTLLTGYLDTDADTTSTVTITGIPGSLTDSEYGYDVYVYALGGVPGRGGAYQVVNPAGGAVIGGYVTSQSPTNSSTYILAQPTAPPAWPVGNYVVFRGLTAPDIRIEGTTVDPWGFGSPNRAPINAVQLVPALEAAPAQPASFDSIIINEDGTITVTWTGAGVLEAAPAINGPWAEIEDATSPFTFPVEEQALFGRIRTD